MYDLFELSENLHVYLSMYILFIYLPCAECNNLIKGVDESRYNKEYPESRFSCDPGETVDKGEEVERYVEVVNHPEEVERLFWIIYNHY